MVEHLHAAEPTWQPSEINISRRLALVGLSGLVVSAMGVERAWAQGPRSCVLTPEAGEGPFYLDPKLLRLGHHFRTTWRAPGSVNAGCASRRLRDSRRRARRCLACRRVRAVFGLCQAERRGRHLHRTRRRESSTLRGTQFTDAKGNVQFRTIFPSWYGGRTPHVHFKVFLMNKEVVASQIFFPDEINREVFAQWQPYRQHASKRSTFNDNDPIKQGVFSEVARQRGSYAATAVLVVASR